MSKVRLREPSTPQGDGATPPQAVPLEPLRVSGIVVRKTDLVAALRIYVPALADLQVTEDGEHFWLILGEEDGDEGQVAG